MDLNSITVLWGHWKIQGGQVPCFKVDLILLKQRVCPRIFFVFLSYFGYTLQKLFEIV